MGQVSLLAQISIGRAGPWSQGLCARRLLLVGCVQEPPPALMFAAERKHYQLTSSHCQLLNSGFAIDTVVSARLL
jgi:hypothetical protein